MPSEKKTPPPSARPRRPGAGPTLTQGRPTPTAPENSRSSAPLSQPPGKGRSPQPRRSSVFKNLAENIGWGLVIGLPVILVILAILWRTTNGFQGTPSTDNTAQFTPAPTATAGNFVAPPAASGPKDRVLYLQAATSTDPTKLYPMQLFSANADGSNPYQITNTPEEKAGPVWSPDGKQVAFSANGVGVQVVNFDGSGLHTVAYGAFAPVWSPDSKQIAFLKTVAAAGDQGPDRTGTVRVLYVTRPESTPGSERQLAADALGHNWSPDGKQIAFFSLRNAVMFTVEIETGKTQQIVVPDKLGGWYPTFSPDGQTLAFYGNPNPGALVAGLDLAVATSNITNFEVSTPGATPTATPPLTPAATAAPASGDSATAAAATGGANTAQNGTVTAGGTPGQAVSGSPAASPKPTTIPGPPSQISLYTVSRDGSNLKKLQDLEPTGGSGGGRYRFSYYVGTSADLTATLAARPSYKTGPVWSPDGKNVAALYIASGDKAGVALVPTAGGQPALVVDGQNGLEAGTRLSPSFAADGGRLFYTFTPPSPVKPTPGPGTPQIDTPSQPMPKQIRFFDLNSKAEQTLLRNNDNSYLSCCGLLKR